MQETLATTIVSRPRKQRAGRGKPQPFDLLVDRRILFDVGVGTRDVGLRLIIIEVADEIFDRVTWEELFELRVELRRERLVVRDDERGPIELTDDIGHGERLARAGHAEQRLVTIAGFDRLQQLRDRLALIAFRLVVRFEFKRHQATLAFSARVSWWIERSAAVCV